MGKRLHRPETPGMQQVPSADQELLQELFPSGALVRNGAFEVCPIWCPGGDRDCPAPVRQSIVLQTHTHPHTQALYFIITLPIYLNGKLVCIYIVPITTITSMPVYIIMPIYIYSGINIHIEWKAYIWDGEEWDGEIFLRGPIPGTLEGGVMEHPRKGGVNGLQGKA